jgi:hypothetical protein
VDLEVRKFQDPFNHENCTGDELGEIKKTPGKNLKDAPSSSRLSMSCFSCFWLT